jgi:hypothetical protein
MQIKPRRPLPTRAGPALVVARSSRRRRRWPWVLGSAALILVGALAYVSLAWPRGTLRVDEVGLPQVQLPRLAGPLVRVSVRSGDGTLIPVPLRPDGTLWPRRRVIPGTVATYAEVKRCADNGPLYVGGVETLRNRASASPLFLYECGRSDTKYALSPSRKMIGSASTNSRLMEPSRT